MNKIFSILSVGMLAVMAVGCTDDREVSLTDGSVAIRTSVTSDIEIVRSRAATLDEAAIAELSAQCELWISGEKGRVRRYKDLATLPASITLLAGNYVAEAWTGDSVSASFDKKCYYGRQPFTIQGGNQTPVELVCNISNVVAEVVFSESARNALKDCVLTIGHRRGSLDFELGGEHTVGYYMMPSTDPDLAWKLVGHDNTGQEVVKEGVIEKARKATQYCFNVNYDPQATPEVGGGYFDIVIDETEIKKAGSVVIMAAPEISGVDFDINQPVYGEYGNMSQRKVVIGASSYLQQMFIGNASIGKWLNLGDGVTEVNLCNIRTELNAALNAAGIYVNSIRNEELATETMVVTFEPEFLNNLEEGEYPITFKATSGTGSDVKTTERTFTLVVTNAAVEAVDVDEISIWATHAVIAGRKLKSDATGLGLRYRAVGTADWTVVPSNTIVTEGNTFSAQITGLTPGTRYEFTADAADFTGTSVKRFTTETAAQLPNGDFEGWYQDGKVLMLYPQGGEKFWDSGNHGSATMNKNVTEQDGTLKHSGSYAAKLSSQFVGIGSIGKFAAGNAFTGEYLATQGTDGVLGFGRDFSSRPTKVRAYVRYETGAITDIHKDWATEMAAAGVVSGQTMDKGIIYVAVFNGSKPDSYDGKNYPCVVRTKKDSNRKLFDKTAANVIGYGEWTSQENTAGDGLIQIEIPIDYSKSEKAGAILVVCSASYWGDYFTGYNGATMWVDDVELVYE